MLKLLELSCGYSWDRPPQRTICGREDLRNCSIPEGGVCTQNKEIELGVCGIDGDGVHEHTVREALACGKGSRQKKDSWRGDA